MRALLAVMALVACSSPVEHVSNTETSSAPATSTAATSGGSQTSPNAVEPAAIRWGKATVVFGSKAECQSLLGRSDGFTKAMSAFDRGVRMGRNDTLSEQEMLSHAAAQCLEWPETELEAWRAIATKLQAALADLHLELPDRISIFVTTGKEEFAAAYTRGPAIVLPVTDLRAQRPSLLAHELFHVATRHRPAIRDGIYALFGFRRVDGFVYPSALEARRITNPDAYHYEHATKVEEKGFELEVVPILQATKPLAEAMGADIGALVSVQLADASGQKPKVRPAEATDYMRRVSINSPYVIHPEELAADNFALVIARRMGDASKAKNVEVLDALEKKL